MNIKLRAPEPGDLDALYLWENDADVSRYGSAEAPYSRAMLWEYIRNYTADPFRDGQLRLMVEAGDSPVGAVDLYDVDRKNRRAFVGIVIDPLHRGRGIGRMALDAFSDYCRDSLGLHQLCAVVPAGNRASVALFEETGFERVAQLPDWVRFGKEFCDAWLLRRQL